MDQLQGTELTINCNPVGVIKVLRPKAVTSDDFCEFLEALLGLLCTFIPVPITDSPRTFIRIGIKGIYEAW